MQNCGFGSAECLIKECHSSLLFSLFSSVLLAWTQGLGVPGLLLLRRAAWECRDKRLVVRLRLAAAARRKKESCFALALLKAALWDFR